MQFSMKWLWTTPWPASNGFVWQLKPREFEVFDLFTPRVCWPASAPPSGRAWTPRSRWSCCCWRCGCGCWGPLCSIWSLCSWLCCADLLRWRETAAGEEERGRLVNTQEVVYQGRNQTLDAHRLLSEFVVKSLQTLVGVVQFPPCLLLKESISLDFCSF